MTHVGASASMYAERGVAMEGTTFFCVFHTTLACVNFVQMCVNIYVYEYKHVYVYIYVDVYM